MVGNQRQGWAIFAAMFALWLGSAAVATDYEVDGNPRVDAAAANMEGKEVRFGAARVGAVRRLTTGTSTAR